MARAIAVVDVLDRRGRVLQRVRVEALPFTIGRAYTNDLILDDPYVSPEHAALRIDAEDGLIAADRGSENGLFRADAPGKRCARVAVRGGSLLRVGRTQLRVRPADHPVPEAARDVSGASRVQRAFVRPVPALLVCASATVLFGLGAFLERVDETGLTTLVGYAVLILSMLSIWASGWALVNRVVAHEFRFLSHLAVACAGGLAFLLLESLLGYVAFLTSSVDGLEAADVVASALITAVVLYAHLSLLGTVPAGRRAFAAGLASVAMFGLVQLSALDDRSAFSTALDFPTELRPVDVRYLRPRSVEDFFAQSRSLEALLERRVAEADAERDD